MGENGGDKWRRPFARDPMEDPQLSPARAATSLALVPWEMESHYPGRVLPTLSRCFRHLRVLASWGQRALVCCEVG